jgi:hypothetical protein
MQPGAGATIFAVCDFGRYRSNNFNLEGLWKEGKTEGEERFIIREGRRQFGLKSNELRKFLISVQIKTLLGLGQNKLTTS